MPVKSVFRRALTKLLLGSEPATVLKKIVSQDRTSSVSYDILPRRDYSLKNFAPTEGISYYKRVRNQLGFVGGVVKLRTDAVLALPHPWVAGSPNDPESQDWAEGIRQASAQVKDAVQAMRKIMEAVPDGLAIAEYIYGPVDVAITKKSARDTAPDDPTVGQVVRTETWIVPVRIVDLDIEKFGYDRDFNLRLRRPGDAKLGELVDQMKVVSVRYGSAQPYGYGEMDGICQDSWKLDWIDREGLKSLERHGIPMAQVTVPEAWDEVRIGATLAWADQTYKNFMIVQLGDRFEISFPDQTARPTFIGADQVERIKQIQDDISVGYLGVAFSNTDRGGKARDQVRNEMRFEKTAGDAAVYDALWNDWEEKVRLINRPSMASFKKASMVTDYKPTEDVATRSNVYVQAVGLGFPASKQQYGEEFGLRQALNDQDKMEKIIQPTVGGAQPGQRGPKNKTAMNRNINSVAENDNARTSSISVMSEG